jgi:hypothetical protein
MPTRETERASESSTSQAEHRPSASRRLNASGLPLTPRQPSAKAASRNAPLRGLENLPPEIGEMIAQRLDNQDLARFAQASRTTRDFSAETLKKRMKLAAASRDELYKIMAEEEAINRANLIAKLGTMGLKAAKDIVG